MFLSDNQYPWVYFFPKIESTFLKKIFEAITSFHIIKFIKFCCPVHLQKKFLQTFIFWNIWGSHFWMRFYRDLTFGTEIFPLWIFEELNLYMVDDFVLCCSKSLCFNRFNLIFLGRQFQDWSWNSLYQVLIVKLNFSYINILFRME